MLAGRAVGNDCCPLYNSPHEYCRLRSPVLARNQTPLPPDRGVKLPAGAIGTATAETGRAGPIQADIAAAVAEQHPRGRFLVTAAVVEPKPITKAGVVGTLVWCVNETASAVSPQKTANAPARRWIDLIASNPSPRSTEQQQHRASRAWRLPRYIDTDINPG